MTIKHITIGAGVIALGVLGASMLHNTQRIGPRDLYPTLTPGVTNSQVTQANIQDTICKSGWTATIRPQPSYTSQLKTKQLLALGVKNIVSTAYEEDHFISLELGGNPTDPNNLWPELYVSSIPGIGAHTKDLVENVLKRSVCSGEITLKQAQDIITTDWYNYYLTHIEGKLGIIQEGKIVPINEDIDPDDEQPTQTLGAQTVIPPSEPIPCINGVRPNLFGKVKC